MQRMRVVHGLCRARCLVAWHQRAHAARTRRRCRCQHALRHWRDTTNALHWEHQRLESARAHAARQLVFQAMSCWLFAVPTGLPTLGPAVKTAASEGNADPLAWWMLGVQVA